MKEVTSKIDKIAQDLEDKGLVEEAKALDVIANTIEAADKGKTLVMLRGISGTGKSILAKQVEKEYGAKAMSTDDYFMQSGEYKFNPKELGKAHAWNTERAKEAIRAGKNVIVDNTNTQAWEMKDYVEEAIKHGYNVVFKEPNWSAELKDKDGKWNIDFIEKLQQNKDRAEIGKSLPREIIQRMADRYEHDVDVDKVLKSKKPF